MATRSTLYPIQHPEIWEAYKKQQAHFWTAEEIRLTQDTRDWLLLDDKERFFLKHVLAFFAGSDGVVAENIGERFIGDVEEMEAKICYGYQAMMEGVHAEMYSILLDTLVRDAGEKARLFSATQTIPCIAKKNRWATHWAGDDSCYAKRLVAFSCVEGILFSGSFCAIFWLKQRGLMPGLTTSNEFIARDEGLHTDFACLMYRRLEAPLDAEIVLDIVSDAVEIEKEFICESLPCSMLGMNARMMCTYIEFVADRLLVQLGYARHYRATNPFGFMERMSLDGKDNFFEKRVTAYAKAGVGLGLRPDASHMEFGEEEAF